MTTRVQPIPVVATRNTMPNDVTKGSKNLTTKAVTKQPKAALTNITNQIKPTTRTGKATKPEKASSKSKVTMEVVKTSEAEKKVDLMLVDQEEDTAMNLSPEPWEDIDALDKEDTQAVSEYVNDIYVTLMLKEKSCKLGQNFLANQTEVTEKMRAILVDWLVEVHHMFKLIPEVLFLAVYMTDRYLEKEVVSRDKLQLVGITSLFTAAKYEEIYAPECNDFVHVSDGAYDKDQILETERNMLNVLEFNLTCPNPLLFLRRYSKAAGSDYHAHTLCKYLIELVLIDTKMLKFVPSEVAAGAVYVARAMTNKTPAWTATLQHYSTYSEEHVKPIAVEINNLLKKAQKSSLKAILKKYSSDKYAEVAMLPLVDF